MKNQIHLIKWSCLIVLCAVAVLALSACKSGKSEHPAAQPSAGEHPKIEHPK